MLLWKNYGGGKPAAIQTRSLLRPWHLFPRLVFLIKPSEACFGVGVIELLSNGVMERGSRNIYELFPIESRRNDSVFLAS